MHAHVQGSRVHDHVNIFKNQPIFVYMAVVSLHNKLFNLIVLGSVLFKIMSTARLSSSFVLAFSACLRFHPPPVDAVIFFVALVSI